MKRNLILAFALMLTAVFTGCSDDDEKKDQLSLSESELPAVAASSQVTFDVTSNVAWEASSNVAWTSLNPHSGNGNATVTVTVDANTGDARTATITVTGGPTPKTVTINQAAAAAEPDPEPISGVLGDGTDEFEINANLRLTYPNTYILKGFVYVTSGTTLTIDPGVIIKGDKATKGTLIIEPGATIMAQGTKDLPIVFTSNFSAGNRHNGDWGGLIICGKAPNNLAEQQIEGGPRTIHGGNDPEDNSGVLQYVRIEFAGMAYNDNPTSNSEINGLTMGSVGTGTTIDHVQVSYSGDDSYEWFGGTVNARYLVAYSGFDDDFDTDTGFSGHLQFVLGVRNPRMADQSASNGFESDNNADGAAISPYTTPIFSNVSLFGPVTDPENYMERGHELGTQVTPVARFQATAHLRRNTHLNVFNSVFAGYPIGLIIENDKGSATQTAATDGLLNINNVVMAGMVKDFQDAQFNVDGNIYNAILSDDAFGYTYFNRAGGNNQTFPALADLKLKANPTVEAPVYELEDDSPLASGAAWTHANVSTVFPWVSDNAGAGSGFEKVNYIGAFGPTETAANNWASGWCNFDPQNTPY